MQILHTKQYWLRTSSVNSCIEAYDGLAPEGHLNLAQRSQGCKAEGNAEAAEQQLTCIGKIASMDGECKCCLTMVRMMAGVQCAGGLPCSPRACTSLTHLNNCLAFARNIQTIRRWSWL